MPLNTVLGGDTTVTHESVQYLIRAKGPSLYPCEKCGNQTTAVLPANKLNVAIVLAQIPLLLASVALFFYASTSTLVAFLITISIELLYFELARRLFKTELHCSSCGHVQAKPL